MSELPSELQNLAGRYRVERELAHGGMGTVYDGFDTERQARCAIKVLKNKCKSSQIKRFQREAMLGARLAGHPGIVTVYDSGALPSTQLYCVMEFVEGRRFDDTVRGMPRKEAVELVVQVARALAYAHERDVIHRDLKPENVLVTSDGQARLTDFGIAKALDDVEGLTATGAVMGTINFMPPEQILDSKRVDERSDVYGLGGLLYVAITGKPPLELGHLSMRDALMQVLDMAIVPPETHQPTIDACLSSICLRALARDPDHRQASAAAFADELEAWLRGDRAVRALPPEYASAAGEDEPEYSSGLVFAVIIGVGLMAVAGLVAFALSGA